LKVPSSKVESSQLKVHSSKVESSQFKNDNGFYPAPANPERIEHE
jgi:hypothetical protein